VLRGVCRETESIIFLSDGKREFFFFYFENFARCLPFFFIFFQTNKFSRPSPVDPIFVEKCVFDVLALLIKKET